MKTKIYVMTSTAMPTLCRIGTSNDPVSHSNRTAKHDFQPVPFSVRAQFGVDCEPDQLHGIMDAVHNELEDNSFAKDFYSCTALEAVEAIRICLARAGLENDDPVANHMVMLYTSVDEISRSQNYTNGKPGTGTLLSVISSAVMERMGPVPRHYIVGFATASAFIVVRRFNDAMRNAGYAKHNGLFTAPVSVAVEHLKAAVLSEE